MAVAQQNEPHESQINGGRSGQPPISSTTQPFEEHTTSKRQRRPSVRLVEIGDQPAASLAKQGKPINNRPSKTRTLTNYAGLERDKGDYPLDNLAIGSWNIKGSKPKREPKRPRVNWVSKDTDDEGLGGITNGGEQGFSKDFEMEGSESPLKGQEKNPVFNPLDDDDDDDDDNIDERVMQFKAPNNIRARSGDDGVDYEGPSYNNGGQSGKRWEKEDDGVRVWLDGLGLGRYWPFFEIHEVDEEVLPLLTLEDLKDMGINAVGSRRKMYSAIQKLNNEGVS